MRFEPTVHTEDELQAVLARVSMRNSVLDFAWQFHTRPIDLCGPDRLADRCGWLVWCTFTRPDTDTNAVGTGRGRDEIVWFGTTVSGVVKTAWLLIELLVRHELMEGFRFDDSRIFNPHNSVFDLADVQTKHGQ